MSNSSILGGSSAPQTAPGSDVDSLGPSDSSDSGSDIQGERPLATRPDNPAELGGLPADQDTDTDAYGTGERASADGIAPRDNADILPDRIDDLSADGRPDDIDAQPDGLADEEDPVESPDAADDGVASRPDSGRRI